MRPFRSGSSRESAEGGRQKIIFQKRQPTQKYNSKNDYHQSYRNRSFGTGHHKFSEALAQKILPRTDSTGKIAKTSFISKKSLLKRCT